MGVQQLISVISQECWYYEPKQKVDIMNWNWWFNFDLIDGFNLKNIQTKYFISRA